MNYWLQNCRLHTNNQLDFFLTWSVTTDIRDAIFAILSHMFLETVIRLTNQVAWQIWPVIRYIESTVFVFNSNIFYLLRK